MNAAYTPPLTAILPRRSLSLSLPPPPHSSRAAAKSRSTSARSPLVPQLRDEDAQLEDEEEYPFPSMSSESAPRARLGSSSSAAQPLQSEQERGTEIAAEKEDGEEGEEELSPLDRSLEELGMGRYQMSVLVLCGLGWATDNMTLQCVGVILPRVQQHYAITDRYIGLLSTSIFAGMMLGAYGWGVYSDARGRLKAFNNTLLISAVFGVAAAFAPGFGWLCLALFGLGVGVGGSMPTDGTLFLENIPKSRHYLLTALSIFFSVGAVITSLLGLWILPNYSCPEGREDGKSCDMELENQGWRYMLFIVGLISTFFCLARVVLFRLFESPKFLAARGDLEGALRALRSISKVNGNDKEWTLEDVIDRVSRSVEGKGEEQGMLRDFEGGYEATGDSDSPLSGRASPVDDLSVPIPSPSLSVRRGASRRMGGSTDTWVDGLPVWTQEWVREYELRMAGLFEPRWKRTTVLVWCIWGFVSAGYTIFNVFLPKWLEAKVGHQGGGRQESLEDYVLYTVSGMPGSILGAYMIETSFGRRGTMTSSTLATFIGILIFVSATSQVGVVLSSMAVSVAATCMFSVIYAYTPEVFEPGVRGTACGIASAFSRLAGIIAPIVTGLLIAIDISVPLYVSAMCFLFSAGCMIALPIETRGGKKVVGLGH